MIAFEVRLNGKILCLASVGEYGLLTQGLTWVTPSPGYESTSPSLHVGGLVDNEHIDWLESPPDINIGDEVVIKILDVETADAPTQRTFVKMDDDSLTKTKRQLLSVHDLLPSPGVKEDYFASSKSFEDAVTKNKLELAVELLEALGDLNGGSPEFWGALKACAVSLDMYDEATRYRRRAG